MNSNSSSYWIEQQNWFVQIMLLPVLVKYEEFTGTRLKEGYRLFGISSLLMIPVSVFFTLDDPNLLFFIPVILAAVSLPFFIEMLVGLYYLIRALAPFVIIISALFLLGEDIYTFLKEGRWTILYMTDFYPIRNTLLDPSDWVGLKQLAFSFLSSAPVWALAAFVGWIVYSTVYGEDDDERPIDRYLREYLKARAKHPSS